MPQPRFDRLTERLLTAGIAPRHVRRYARELSDHYDDLLREETAAGAGRELAEARALARLGSEEDLAEAMLSQPGLRSLTARYPWAVFGLGPVALLALSVVGGLYFEVWLINHTGFAWAWFGMQPSPSTARTATKLYTAYNTLIVYGGPLLFAWLFTWIGARQRMRPAWIVTGVALFCVLGGFQNLVFYDTGCRGCGHLMMSSALIPPFPHFLEGLARAAMNLAIAGGVWFLSARRHMSAAIALSHTART